MIPGQTTQFTCTCEYTNCNGSISYSNQTSGALWSSSNTAVATVSLGLVKAVAVGTAGIKASFTDWFTDASCQRVHQTYSSTSSCDVTPTVSVSCSPLDLALGPTAPSTTTIANCSTTVSPAGGTYSWSVNTNEVTLSASGGGASVTAANQSSSKGDTVVSVTYTLNSQSATAKSAGITVHQPTSLYVQSDSTNPTGWSCTVTCLNGQSGCSYTSYLRQRTYIVEDQFGSQFPSVGINNIRGVESYSGLTSSCGASSVLTGTAPTSTFTDQFHFCSTACLAGGSGCTTSATQTITVNGFQVRTEGVTWTCSGVTLSP